MRILIGGMRADFEETGTSDKLEVYRIHAVY